MAVHQITCPMCGFKNPADAGRCRSCGAKVEEYSATYTKEEEDAKRYQQESFEWKWAFSSCGVYLAVQGLVLGILPLVITRFDPIGFGGLALSILVWFVGGAIVGLISPGKTFVEPAVGAILAVIPTVAFLAMITPSGFQPSLLTYIVGGVAGVMVALLGAFLGERVQMMTRGNAKR
ncbi:MAG: zinc ribbon domain-containing protein [Deltaproteobacteria bacterium]|nr:zinc ribbon domain-containing protein [Deltaproteobacteria bacterium]